MGKDLVVRIEDHFGDEVLTDKMDMCENDVPQTKRTPFGFVEIYDITEEEKKLIGKHNLVVYQGREWLGERIFNTENALTTPTKDEYISWFGVGTGGCPPGDPLNPTSPTNLDTDLDTKVGFNGTDHTYAELIGGTYYKHPFDSVAFEQDTDNANKYLVCRLIITIGIDDANGNNLTEAGLYTSESVAGGYAGPFNLFARVTFPSIVKTTSRQLVFVWYMYC